jgi:hypothetical protein
VCSSGACSVSCAQGQTNCAGGCINTPSDHANCGACGHACRADQVCTTGACVCPTGKTECSGACVTLASDHANCGGCGRACHPTEVCTAGQCSLSCPSGQKDCNGSCVDTNTDTNNCLVCGHVCPQSPPGNCQKAACSVGLCGEVCDVTNTPYPSNPCYDGICLNCAQPVQQPKPAGTPCSFNGGSVCDGSGHCAQCNSAADCPTPSDPCLVAVCNPGTYGATCNTSPVPDNTSCGSNHRCCSGACYALGTSSHCTSCAGCTPPAHCCPGQGCTTAACL